MIAAGVDVGHRTTKLVLLEGGKILWESVLANSDEARIASRAILDDALRAVGRASGDVGRIIATGAMGKEVDLTGSYRPSMACLAKGVYRQFPRAKTVIDLGGETCNVLKIGEGGAVVDTQGNDKCAAGTGIFFEAISKLLGTSLEGLGQLAVRGQKVFEISSMCVVFAEQEVISHAHENPDISAEDLAASLHASIADRVAGLAKRLGVEEEVVLTGGCARNPGYVKHLSEKLEVVVRVPERPELASAYGAALLAEESGRS